MTSEPQTQKVNRRIFPSSGEGRRDLEVGHQITSTANLHAQKWCEWYIFSQDILSLQELEKSFTALKMTQIS